MSSLLLLFCRSLCHAGGLSLFYRENKEVKIDYEEDVEIRQEKTPWIGICIIFKGKLPFS